MPFILVGRIGRPFGLVGEMNVSREAEGFELLAERPHWFVGFDPDSVLHVRVESVRPRGSSRDTGLVASLAGVNSRTEAVRLSGAWVYLPSGEVPVTGRFKAGVEASEIIGFSVLNEAGDHVGTVDDYVEMPAQDLIVVIRPDGKEVLIPATPEIVRQITGKERTVVVRLVEGLLDL